MSSLLISNPGWTDHQEFILIIFICEVSHTCIIWDVSHNSGLVEFRWIEMTVSHGHRWAYLYAIASSPCSVLTMLHNAVACLTAIIRSTHKLPYCGFIIGPSFVSCLLFVDRCCFCNLEWSVVVPSVIYVMGCILRVILSFCSIHLPLAVGCMGMVSSRCIRRY